MSSRNSPVKYFESSSAVCCRSLPFNHVKSPNANGSAGFVVSVAVVVVSAGVAGVGLFDAYPATQRKENSTKEKIEEKMDRIIMVLWSKITSARSRIHALVIYSHFQSIPDIKCSETLYLVQQYATRNRKILP